MVTSCTAVYSSISQDGNFGEDSLRVYRHSHFVPVSTAFGNLNRHVINTFNATYGAAKSHLQMNCAVYEHFFSSVNFGSLIVLLISLVCMCVRVSLSECRSVSAIKRL